MSNKFWCGLEDVIIISGSSHASFGEKPMLNFSRCERKLRPNLAWFLVRDFVSSIAFLKGKPRLNQTSWKTRFLTHQICLSLNRKKHQLSERPLACARPCRIAGACLRVNTCALRVSPFTHGFQGWPARRTTRQGFDTPKKDATSSSHYTTYGVRPTRMLHGPGFDSTLGTFVHSKRNPSAYVRSLSRQANALILTTEPAYRNGSNHFVNPSIATAPAPRLVANILPGCTPTLYETNHGLVRSCARKQRKLNAEDHADSRSETNKGTLALYVL